MQLDNKVYDILKFVVTIVMPALATLYLGISGLLAQNGLGGLPYPEVVAGIITLLCTFLGTVLRISTNSYKGEGTLNVDSENQEYSLVMDTDFDKLVNQKAFVVTVNNASQK